ncbi:MAG: T9SS type A sorting domain-containing protein [Bacteroidota bacterium]|jgi:hypothetical protein
MKFKFLLGALFVAFGSYAQTIQQLKDSAATFPPMPRVTSDLIPFTIGLPTFASGAPFDDLEFTIFDTDYMDGENSGGDVFMPVDPSDILPGSNKVKLIRCILNTDLDFGYQSGKADRVILGTSEIPNPFFLRGTDGIDNDYCVIQHLDFRYGYIQLKGQPSDYRLIYCTTAEGCQTTGWYLFYTANNNIDLIAFIYPCWDIEPSVSGNPPNNPNPICNSDSILSLTNTNHFKYAQPISTAPSIPQSISQFGSNGKEVVGGMTMDNQGNTYFFGLTDGNLDGQSDSENEIFVNKISPSGQQLWVTELPMNEGTLLKAGITDNSHIYVAGRTLGNLPGFTNAGRWDGILLKLNLSDGQIVATNQWGNAGIDGYGNITQDDAGNIFVSAQGSPSGPATTDDVYLVAKHQKSNLQNVWRALNPPNATGFIASAEAWGGLTYVPSSTPGVGRLIAAGWYFSNLGANAFVSVYENLHTSTPTRPHSIVINTPGARADWVLDNKVDNQGNIYVAGFTTGNLQGTHIGEGDAFIIKYSPQLTNPIIKQLGTIRSDLFRKLVIDDNNNLFAVGYSYGNYNGNTNTDPSQKTADIIVQKFDQNLILLASKQFGTPSEDRGYCYLKDSILLIGGMTEGAIKSASNGSFDGFLLALNTTDLSFNSNPVLSVESNQLSEQIKYYPNPTNNLVIFEIKQQANYQYSISNQLGQQISKGQISNSANTISLADLSNGIYFINLNDQQTNKTIKIMKQ